MMTNCENLKSLLTSQNLEKMKSGKIVADLNKKIIKLKRAFKKKDSILTILIRSNGKVWSRTKSKRLKI